MAHFTVEFFVVVVVVVVCVFGCRTYAPMYHATVATSSLLTVLFSRQTCYTYLLSVKPFIIRIASCTMLIPLLSIFVHISAYHETVGPKFSDIAALCAMLAVQLIFIPFHCMHLWMELHICIVPGDVSVFEQKWNWIEQFFSRRLCAFLFASNGHGTLSHENREGTFAGKQ